jgi:nitrate/nitrite-specific signal transduction histidine kinase
LNETQNVVISTEEKILQTSKIEFDLNERVKELSCLYTISSELDHSERISKALPNCIQPLINGFQFPEFASVRIEVDGDTYGEKACSCHKANMILKEDIFVEKRNRGFIKVCYHQKANFLLEEKKLLKEISTMIAKALEKEDLKFELQKHLGKLEGLVKDLEKQKKVLLLKNKKLLELSQECGTNRKQLESLFNAITDIIVVIDSDYNILISNKEEIGNSGKCHQKIFNIDQPCIDCPAVMAFQEAKPVSIEKKSG